MQIKTVIEELNFLRESAVIEDYAIGGAVGATFYLEPMSTLDVDVFVSLPVVTGKTILDPTPIFSALSKRGYPMEGEYVVIAGWPVQFLSPSGALGEEALARAEGRKVDGVPVRVFSAEYLAAIALQTGRAKDKARLLAFIEQGVLNADGFSEILSRHGLEPSWKKFRESFLPEQP